MFLVGIENWALTQFFGGKYIVHIRMNLSAGQVWVHSEFWIVGLKNMSMKIRLAKGVGWE